MDATTDQGRLLRVSLSGNALFSGLSGLVLLLAPGSVASFLGLTVPWIVATIGAGLMLYAVWLAALARRPVIPRIEAWGVISLDVAWVLGSLILLIADPLSLTLTGKWTVTIVADFVTLFATLQFFGLHRYVCDLAQSPP